MIAIYSGQQVKDLEWTMLWTQKKKPWKEKPKKAWILMRKLVLQVKFNFKFSRQIFPDKISPTNCNRHSFPEFFFPDKFSPANFLPTSFPPNKLYIYNYTIMYFWKTWTSIIKVPYLWIFQICRFGPASFPSATLFLEGSALKVDRDRYNLDAPWCKKKAYTDLDLRTLNGMERFSESILNSS